MLSGEDMADGSFYYTLGKTLRKLAPIIGKFDSVCVCVFVCVWRRIIRRDFWRQFIVFSITSLPGPI